MSRKEQIGYEIPADVRIAIRALARLVVVHRLYWPHLVRVIRGEAVAVALRAAKGNVSAAARCLGVRRSCFWFYMTDASFGKWRVKDEGASE